MLNFLSLLPILVFLSLYLLGGVVLQDFYSLSVPILLLVGIVIGVIQNKQKLLNDRLQVVVQGAGQQSIILMCFIFVLAGGFAHLTKSLGAVDTLIHYGLAFFPPSVFLVAIFIMACLISMAMGTSVGTIAALAPIALSLTQTTHLPVEITIGAIVSGAMFGDNLSMVSDTTIVITQIMGCSSKEKAITNFRYIWPAAILTCVAYYFTSSNYSFEFVTTTNANIWTICPYIIVLALSLLGLHVFSTLFVGLVASAIVAITQGYTIVGIMNIIATGFASMSEMVIITLLVGGIIALIQANGGVNYVLNTILSKIKSKRVAETMMVVTLGLVNICVANNTVSLVVSGPLLKEIKNKYQLNAARTASLLDMFSCIVQGLIPYGIQLLMAAKLAATASIFIIPYTYYPILMLITVVFLIARQKNN